MQIIETVAEAVTQIIADPEKPEGLTPAEMEPEAPLAPLLRTKTESPKRRTPVRSATTRIKWLTGGEREGTASKAREKRRKKSA